MKTKFMEKNALKNCNSKTSDPSGFSSVDSGTRALLIETHRFTNQYLSTLHPDNIHIRLKCCDGRIPIRVREIHFDIQRGKKRKTGKSQDFSRECEKLQMICIASKMESLPKNCLERVFFVYQFIEWSSRSSGKKAFIATTRISFQNTLKFKTTFITVVDIFTLASRTSLA